MTGRKYSFFEEYKLEDAEIAIVCMNSTAGTTKYVVDTLREKGIKAIGVDMPSHHLAPDTVITSALKNVGTGGELTIKALQQNTLIGGEPMYYNISNEGVGFEKTYHLHPELIEYVENKVTKYDNQTN